MQKDMALAAEKREFHGLCKDREVAKYIKHNWLKVSAFWWFHRQEASQKMVKLTQSESKGSLTSFRFSLGFHVK